MSTQGPSRTTWLYTIFSIVVVLLAFDALLLSRDLRQVFDIQDRMGLSYRRIEVLDRLFSSVKDVETGQRGYLLSGLESYLVPYEVASADLSTYLVRLDTLYNEGRPALLDEIHYYVNAKASEVGKTVALMSQGEEEEALALFRADSGRVFMDSLRLRVDDLRIMEEQALRRAADLHKDSEERVIATFALTTIVALGLVGFLYLFTARDIRQRTRIERTLRQHRDELDGRVQMRTQELMESNASLQHTVEELARSNRELEEFAYVASHDLQEPLRKIRVFSALLLEQESQRLTGESRDNLERLTSAAERMSRLINDLLIFSRVRSRQEPMQPVDLNTLVAEVRDSLEQEGHLRTAELHIAPLPTVSGDPVLLRQLFEQLFDNALKFRRAGTPLSITVEAGPFTMGNASYQRVCVCDNGVGFEQRYADRIFRPFQRLHAPHEYAGTGIGLAICRRIAERHGALLTAEAEPGKGATFCVAFPGGDVRAAPQQ